MRKSFLTLSILSLSFLIIACNSSSPSPEANTMNSDIDKQEKITNREETSSYRSITAEELSSMLKEKDFTLVDVHIPEQEHIPGTDLIIPYDEIDRQLDKLPQKDRKIVLYCRSGGMSHEASAKLIAKGFTNIINLTGGKNAYDEYRETHPETAQQEASARVDYIDFEAVVLTENNRKTINEELGDLITAQMIIPEKTTVFLSMNNHRTNLEDFDYENISTLNDQKVIKWQQLASDMGGHHVSGLLTFDTIITPETLKVIGLPVGEVELTF